MPFSGPRSTGFDQSLYLFLTDRRAVWKQGKGQNFGLAYCSVDRHSKIMEVIRPHLSHARSQVRDNRMGGRVMDSNR